MKKDILKELKHIQKLIQENEFEQKGEHGDAGFYRGGVFIKSKIVKSKISSLINKVMSNEDVN